MKRASMLGALALAAAGFLFAAPAAQATVTCTGYPSPPLADTPDSNINNWPRIKQKNSNPAVSHIYNCISGSPTSEFHGTWQAAQNIGTTGTNNPPQFLANEFYDNTVRIYFYEDLDDLNSHWNTSYSVGGAGGEIFGVTLRSGDTGSPGVPVGSVGIVRKNSSGTVNNLNAIKGAVHHELGHVFDALQGNPSTDSSSAWDTAKDNDIFQLNATGGGSTLTARNNVFNGIDVQNDYPSCWDEYNDVDTTNPPHTGKTHWQVAQCMWPYFTEDEELFANIFGQRIGGLLAHQGTQPKLYEFSFFFTNKFWDETRDYMDTIDWTGYTP